MKRSSRTRCIALMVDGTPVSARVSGKLTARDLEALREIARAARRHFGPDLLPSPAAKGRR